MSRALWGVTGKKKHCQKWQKLNFSQEIKKYGAFGMGQSWVIYDSVFFFPVTPQSARDTPSGELCHGHFWFFTGTFSNVFTGKATISRPLFPQFSRASWKTSRAFSKIVVTGTLTFVTGTFGFIHKLRNLQERGGGGQQ